MSCKWEGNCAVYKLHSELEAFYLFQVRKSSCFISLKPKVIFKIQMAFLFYSSQRVCKKKKRVQFYYTWTNTKYQRQRLKHKKYHHCHSYICLWQTVLSLSLRSKHTCAQLLKEFILCQNHLGTGVSWGHGSLLLVKIRGLVLDFFTSQLTVLARVQLQKA